MDGTEALTTQATQATQATQDSAAPAARGRRDFLRAAGLGGMTLAVGGALAACADTTPSPLAPAGAPSAAVVSGNNVTLDFANDVDILNYAYALEQLEAAFYVRVVDAPAFASIFPANERRILTDLRDHEVAHREFFETALGSSRIPDLTVNFASVNFGSRASVLATAQTFEDLGVGAYNGAAKFLRSAALLAVAGKIVSVEARHAAAIRAVRNGNRTGTFAPDAFDPAYAPSFVLGQADPFIVQNITVVNA